MRKLLVPFIALVVLAVAAPQVSGQVTFGAQLSYGTDIEELGIGVRAYKGLDDFMEGLTGVASFVYWLWDPGLDSATAWELNIDGHYPMAFGEMDGYLAFDLFFPGQNQSYWEINGNVTFPIPMNDGGSMDPYFGGGLRLAHYGVDIPGVGEVDDTELGLDLLVGSRFASKGKWAPFAELRLPLGGMEGVDFILAVGIYF